MTMGLTVPPDKLPALRRVAVWIDRSHGVLALPQYHPHVDWLAANGYDRAMAKCVMIPSVKAFLAPRTVAAQPCVMLHELAHAYHEQVRRFDDTKIAATNAAYRQFGNHKRVLHYHGKRVEHYAAKNSHEFLRRDDPELTRPQRLLPVPCGRTPRQRTLGLRPDAFDLGFTPG